MEVAVLVVGNQVPLLALSEIQQVRSGHFVIHCGLARVQDVLPANVAEFHRASRPCLRREERAMQHPQIQASVLS